MCLEDKAVTGVPILESSSVSQVQLQLNSRKDPDATPKSETHFLGPVVLELQLQLDHKKGVSCPGCLFLSVSRLDLALKRWRVNRRT